MMELASPLPSTMVVDYPVFFQSLVIACPAIGVMKKEWQETLMTRIDSLLFNPQLNFSPKFLISKELEITLQGHWKIIQLEGFKNLTAYEFFLIKTRRKLYFNLFQEHL